MDGVNVCKDSAAPPTIEFVPSRTQKVKREKGGNQHEKPVDWCRKFPIDDRLYVGKESKHPRAVKYANGKSSRATSKSRFIN
jgi:hypothetical protein